MPVCVLLLMLLMLFYIASVIFRVTLKEICHLIQLHLQFYVLQWTMLLTEARKPTFLLMSVLNEVVEILRNNHFVKNKKTKHL